MIPIKTKIFIDRILGIPAVYFLNIFARILGYILRIDHSLNKPVKNIVVCKFMGMGSIIQSTPMLQTLKKNYPECNLIFITSKANKEIIENIPVIDEAIYLDDDSFFTLITSTFLILLRLWRKKINLYFDLELYSFFSTIITTLSIAVNRFGYYRRANNYRLGIYTHMMYFNNNAPVIQIYLQMCRMAGCCQIIDTLIPVETKEKDWHSLKQKLNLTSDSNYLVINPNASAFFLERRWGKDNFIQLINEIVCSFPNTIIILTGNRHEFSYVDSIAKQVNVEFQDKIINTSGILTVSDLILLIKNAKLLISNDSGPMHLGLLTNTKTIGLFGPGSPQHYTNNAKNLHVFYEQVYCSPCIYNFDTPPCKGDNQCMKRIKVLQVFWEIKNILETGNISNKQINTSNIVYAHMNNNGPLGVIDRA